MSSPLTKCFSMGRITNMMISNCTCFYPFQRFYYPLSIGTCAQTAKSQVLFLWNQNHRLFWLRSQGTWEPRPLGWVMPRGSSKDVFVHQHSQPLSRARTPGLLLPFTSWPFTSTLPLLPVPTLPLPLFFTLMIFPLCFSHFVFPESKYSLFEAHRSLALLTL